MFMMPKSIRQRIIAWMADYIGWRSERLKERIKVRRDDDLFFTTLLRESRARARPLWFNFLETDDDQCLGMYLRYSH